MVIYWDDVGVGYLEVALAMLAPADSQEKIMQNESMWKRAKALAKARGRDYSFAVDTFQELAKANKPDKLQKAYFVPPSARNFRIPGQVPTRESIALMRMAEAKPPPFTMARLMAHDGPIASPHHIVKGLFGADAGKETEWARYLSKTVATATNEITVRQALHQKAMEDRLGVEQRNALFQRTMSYYRDLAKSNIHIVAPDELIKSAKGGKYFKRSKTASGKYRYFYDEDTYNRSGQKQESGPDARKAYVSKSVCDAVGKAGKGGCDVKSLRDLAKKFGKGDVAGVLRDETKSGKLVFKGGKLYPGKNEKVSDERKK